MEVHHHSHAHGKKNWKTYLWEFRMLFLAVFCGFLAENQREHLIEHNREKQFIRSMAEDLENDIAYCNQITAPLSESILFIDSIQSGFNQLKNGTMGKQLATMLASVTGFPDFVYTDKTIQQLKNGGNMRLIRKMNVSDSISQYDAHVRNILVHQDVMNDLAVNSFLKTFKYTFSLEALNRLRAGNYAANEEERLLNQVLLTHNEVELTRMLNEYIFYKYGLAIHLANVKKVKAKAERTLAVIKKEYDFK